MKNIAIIALILICTVACNKITTSCDYNIITKIQQKEKGSIVSNSDVVGYLFFTDTLKHYPKNYDMCLNGELEGTGGIKKFDLKSDFNPETKAITFSALGEGTIVMVVCDKANKIYSYKQTEILLGTPNVTVALTSYPWRFVNRPDTTLVVNTWIQRK